MNRILFLKTPFAILIALCALIALVASWNWPLIHDAATNHYVADQILRGKTPFLDIFDMNLPGAYLPHLVSLFLFGDSDFSWRIIDIMFMLLAAWSVWRICKSQNEQVGILCACVVILFHLGNGAVFAGQRDWWVAALLLSAAVFLIKALEEKAISYDGLLFMSIFVGAAASIKPFAVFFIPLALTLYLSRLKKKKSWIKLLSSIFFGLALVPFCLLLWMLLSGGFSAFWDIATNYSSTIYTIILIPNSLSGLLRFGKILGLIAIVGGVVGLAIRKFQYAPSHQLVLFAGVCYGFFHFLFQAKGWTYHAYPLFLFSIPLVILWLDSLGKNRRRPKQAMLPFVLMIIFCVGLAARGLTRSFGDESLATIKPYVPELIADLDALNLEEQAYVQVMDTAVGGLHALLRTDLQQSTRTIYDFHFQSKTDEDYVLAMKKEFVEGFIQNEPMAVVVVKKGWLAPHDYSRHDRFPEFLALLKNQYELRKETEDYRLFTKVK